MSTELRLFNHTPATNEGDVEIGVIGGQGQQKLDNCSISIFGKSTNGRGF